MNKKKHPKETEGRFEAYSPKVPGERPEISTSPAAVDNILPLYAPAGAIVTPGEVRRNEIDEEDVERMREWCGENEL
ncbi:MAG: hypothetical protein Q4B42_02685 [Oscillospiraceae bacterium]|nr:hypothetical protein [Oscillospiraceae bacterium]